MLTVFRRSECVGECAGEISVKSGGGEWGPSPPAARTFMVQKKIESSDKIKISKEDKGPVLAKKMWFSRFFLPHKSVVSIFRSID